eukprot:1156905-Pelagomonas_calceolata.AAC.4
MAPCNELSGCVATPHAHAGEAQAVPPQTPLLCQTPSAALTPQEPFNPLDQRPGLLSGRSSTGPEFRVTLGDLLGAGYCWQGSGDTFKEI